MKDIRHYLYESEEEYPFESMEEILAVNAAKQELCESSTSDINCIIKSLRE